LNEGQLGNYLVLYQTRRESCELLVSSTGGPYTYLRLDAYFFILLLIGTRWEQWNLRVVVNNTPRPVSDDSAAVIERQRIQVSFFNRKCSLGGSTEWFHFLTSTGVLLFLFHSSSGYGGRDVAISAGKDL
jgi:hypothetical protein